MFGIYVNFCVGFKMCLHKKSTVDHQKCFRKEATKNIADG